MLHTKMFASILCYYDHAHVSEEYLISRKVFEVIKFTGEHGKIVIKIN